MVGSARLLAESGVGASCTAVVLEIIAAPERDTNNNSDMAGKDVGFIFAIISPPAVDGVVKAKCDAIFFLSTLDFFWLMEIYLCMRSYAPSQFNTQSSTKAKTLINRVSKRVICV